MSAVPLALFVGNWLSYSETFIYDQVQRQQRFAAHVLARGRTAPGNAAFPYPDLTALGPIEAFGYFHAGVSRTFSRALQVRPVKLAHAHFGINGALACPLARRAGIPLVVTFHGHDVPGLFPENRFAARYLRYQRTADAMFDYASSLLCASAELAELLLRLRPGLTPKLRVHRLGIDLQRFTVPARGADAGEAPLRALMVGRMVEKKGMAHGLRAFAAVRAQQPEASLVVVGDGPVRAQLATLARELGVADAVAFRGARSHAEVQQEMAHANVLLTPSVVARDGDRESGVLVLKEAGATALPTIGTRHGGIPEIIDDGVTGLLVPERDDAALGDALLQLARDGALRTRLGLAARTKIEAEYDTVEQNRLLEEHLASLL